MYLFKFHHLSYFDLIDLTFISLFIQVIPIRKELFIIILYIAIHFMILTLYLLFLCLDPIR